MRNDDYTIMPEGLQVDGGVVRVCPHCNLKGLEELTDGRLYYTHHQSVGVNETGHPVVNFSFCPKPLPIPELS